jgi:hypothetical protein
MRHQLTSSQTSLKALKSDLRAFVPSVATPECLALTPLGHGPQTHRRAGERNPRCRHRRRTSRIACRSSLGAPVLRVYWRRQSSLRGSYTQHRCSTSRPGTRWGRPPEPGRPAPPTFTGDASVLRKAGVGGPCGRSTRRSDDELRLDGNVQVLRSVSARWSCLARCAWR